MSKIVAGKTVFSVMASVFVAFMMSACGHSVFLPGSLRQRPDVPTRPGGGSVNFGVRQAAGIEVFSDLSSNPPTRPINAESDLITLIPFPFVDLSIGAFKNTEVYYNTGLGMKWLFVGEPGQEGWRMAVFGGIANDAWTGTEQKDCNANCDKAKTDLKGLEYGFTFGKQVNQSVLLYVTVGQQKGDADSEIEQSGGAKFTYKDKYEHSVATFGLTAGASWYFIGELGMHQTKWVKDEGGSNTVHGNTYVLGAGYRW